jgi:glucosyl-dolichyl phosphate glucuronosyltransferase
VDASFPSVSVIVPTFNRARLISLTLDSLLAQNYPADRFEIVVANNNSTDGTAAVLADYASRHRSVRSMFEGRQGVHYARNGAAKIATGEVLYFTDDDMVAEPDLLREIVKPFALDPTIGAVTGKVLPRWEEPPPDWIVRHCMNSWLSLNDRPEDLLVAAYDVGVFSCHQALTRKAFLEGGGFNPENTAGVWIGDGETGLNEKLRLLGYRFAYTSRAVTHHMIPAGRTTLRYLVGRVGNQGLCDSYTEYRKHRSRANILPRALRRNAFAMPKRLSRTLFGVVRGKEAWQFLPAWLMYFHKRNTYDYRLYVDGAFREVVEIDDWLRDDRASFPSW